MARYYLSNQRRLNQLMRADTSNIPVSISGSIGASANITLTSWKTKAWVPGNSGSWNGYVLTFVINVTTGSTSLFGSIQAYRNGNSIGSAVEQTLAAGQKTWSITISSATLGDGGKDDNIAFELNIRNSSTMAVTFAYQLESSLSYMDSTIPEFATSEPGLIAPRAQYKNDGNYTPVPVGGTTGTYGNADKLLLQSDVSAKEPYYPTFLQEETDAVGVSFANTADLTSKTQYPRPTAFPTARRGGTMSYDSVNKRYINIGGYDGTTRFNELWELDHSMPAAHWRKLAPTGTAPVGKNLGTQVQLNGDNGKSWAIIWGGSASAGDNGTMIIADCTTRGSESFTTVTQTNPPAARSYITQHMTVKKTGANTFDVFLFGGWGSARFNDLMKVSVDMSGAVPTALTWTTLKANAAVGNPTIRSGCVLFYDDTNDRLVMTMGYTGTVYDTAVYAYNLTTNAWSTLSPTGTAPDGRELMAAAYDPTSKRLVMWGGWKGSIATSKNDIVQLDFSSSTAGAWSTLKTNDATNQDQQSYSSGANCYNPDKRLAVSFGTNGIDGTDKYVYAYNFKETTSPALYGLNVWSDFMARDAPAYVWNPTRGEFVLVNGFSEMADDTLAANALNGDHVNQIWAYNPTDNTIRYANQGDLGLPYKEGVMAAYDTTADRIITFGGLTGASQFGQDTWELKADTFGNYKARKMAPTGTLPPVRWLGAMAYDSARNRIIIWGGCNSAMLSDCWQLDLSSGDGAWTQLTPTGTAPTGTWQPSYSYDNTAKRLYVFSGATNTSSSTFSSQLWYLDYTNATPAYTIVGTPAGFTAGRGTAMWYDQANNYCWAYGGYNGSVVSAQLCYINLSSPTAWTAISGTENVNLPAARRSSGYTINPSTGKMYIACGRPVSGRWFSDVWEMTPNYGALSGNGFTEKAPDAYVPYTVELSGRSDGNYHWQATATINSDQAAWASFGNNAETANDFVIGAGSGGSSFTTTRSDTQPTADAATRAMGKVAVDTSTSSDAASKRVTKPAADAVTPTDGTAQSIGRRQTAADSVTETDTSTRATGKKPADALSIGDANTKAIGRTQSDSSTATDSPGLLLNRFLAIGDTVTITDNSITISGKSLTLGDAVAAADAAVKAVLKAFADAATATDANSKAVKPAKADSATVTDANSKRATKAPADSSTATDSNTKSQGYGYGVGDFAYPTDVNSKGLTKKDRADSATVTDLASTGAARAQAASDSVTSSDSSSRRETLGKADAVTPTDSAAGAAARFKTNTDSVLPIDSATKASAKTTADTAATTDATTKAPKIAKADNATATDSLTRAVSRVLAFADTITLSDARIKAMARLAADIITTGDAPIPGLGKAITSDDSVTATDASSRQAQPQPADSVTTSDSESHKQGWGRTPSDTLIADDAVAKAIARLRDDTAFVTDSTGGAAPGINRHYNAEDVISAAEAMMKAVIKPRSDSSTATDSMTKGLGLNRTAADSATSSDDSFRSPGKNPVDNVFLSDLPSITNAFIRAFADIISSTDSSTRRVVLTRAETPAATDATTKTIRKPMADTLAAADAAVKTLRKFMADTATISDSGNANGVSNWTQNVADSVLAVESSIRRVAQSLAETLAATDAVVKVVSKAQSDSAAATDDNGKKFVMHPSQDAITAVDASSRRVLTGEDDSVTASDTSGRTVRKLPADSVTALDAQAKSVKRLAADSVTLIDSMLKALALYYYASENLVTSDAINKAIILNRVDLLTADDDELAVKAIQKVLNDQVFTAELASRAVTKRFDDNYEAIEDANILAARGFIISDIVAAADAQFKKVSMRNNETLLVQDAITKATTFLIADQYGVSDLSTRQVRKLLEDGTVIAEAITKVIRATRRDTVTVTDEALEDRIRIITGNIIAISARSNNVRGAPVRGSGYRQ